MDVILIAHRGNINGPNPDHENHPDYLTDALDQGFHIEVDVWITKDGRMYFGHDYPQYCIDESSRRMLNDDRVWCHAKNLAALEYLLENNCHVFSHDKDDYVITSRKVIWAYPGKPIKTKTKYPLVCVMPEVVQGQYTTTDLMQVYGVCTDYVLALKNKFKSSGVPKQ